MAYVYGIPMIVTEAAKLNSGEVFNVLDDDSGGTNTFSVALSPTGQANATHWGANFYRMDEALLHALRDMSITEFKAYVDAEATRKGRTIPGSVTAFKNSLQIGSVGENFWTFAARVGLQPVAVEAMKK